MSVCIGDTVRFLNDVGGGTVTRLKGKIVYVLINEGFEIPVNISEIVIIASKNDNSKNKDGVKEQPKTKQYNTDFQVSYNYADREENSFAEEEVERKEDEINSDIFFQSNINQEYEEEFYLALVAENKNKTSDNGLNLYLINNSEYYLIYSVGIFENGEHALLDSGIVEPGIKVLISEISKESYQTFKGLSCQAIKYKKGMYQPTVPIDEELKIRSYKLLSDSIFKENNYFDFPAWLIPLNSSFNNENPVQVDPEIISKVVAEKEKAKEDTSRRFKKKPEPVLVEIDLHINQLVEDVRGMSNTEMLAVQLSKFGSELEKAIADKIHRIVFIHGIGNGTLKMAIRKELDEHYKHLQYQDASYKEYGYGATMVILKRG